MLPKHRAETPAGRWLPVLTGPILTAWMAAALILLVPIFIIAATPHPVQEAWTGSLAVTTISGLTYSWLIGRGQRRLSHLTFTLFTYIFLGLAPMVQQRTGTDPPTTPGIEHTLDSTTYYIICIGFVSFLIGSWGTLTIHRQPADNLRKVGRGAPTINTPRVIAISTMALAIGWYYMVKVGLASIFSSRDQLSMKIGAIWPDSATQGLVRSLSAMTLLVAFVSLRQLRYEVAERQKIRTLLLWVVGISMLIVVNPITSPRYSFGTVALSVAAAAGLYATPLRFRITAVFALLAMIYLFPILGALRRGPDIAIAPTGPISTLSSGDFDAFGQINNAVRFVLTNGSTHGHQALGVLLFWTPRSIWPSKPIDTGILLANSRGYAFTNLSAPLWAELYVNGGWLALVLGMIVLGFISGKADRAIEHSLLSSGSIGILGCILPFYQIILLRGSLMQATSGLAVIVAVGVFVRQRTATKRRDDHAFVTSYEKEQIQLSPAPGESRL